jgi:hypothetical protein
VSSSPTSIRFPDVLRMRIEGFAEQERRSFSQAVLLLCERGLNAPGVYLEGVSFGSPLEGRDQEEVPEGGATTKASGPRKRVARASSRPSSGGRSSLPLRGARRSKDAAPAIGATPTQGGASPVGNDGVKGAATTGAEPAVTGPSFAGEEGDGPPESAPTSTGAEPAATGAAADSLSGEVVGDGEGALRSGAPESAPVPAAGASQGGARSRRPRSGKCPHGVAAGSYCKRCGG